MLFTEASTPPHTFMGTSQINDRLKQRGTACQHDPGGQEQPSLARCPLRAPDPLILIIVPQLIILPLLKALSHHL
eukprot:scaffold113561_cov22-Tisochrysis_lutea.AAC.1